MPAFDPEAIESALFDLIVNATSGAGFQRTSRHAKIWGATSIAQQPALYLIPLGAAIDQENAFQLPRYKLHYVVVCYARANVDPNTIPQTALYAIWAAIDAALRPKPAGERQTLGGKVHHAWIDGEVLLQPGVIDEQLGIEIPISALTGV